MEEIRDLEDGEVVLVQGSAAKPYELRNVGGIYSCTCAAWRFQSLPIDRRTCKHIKRFRGAEAEVARVGEAAVHAAPANAPHANAAAAATEPAIDANAPPVLLAHRWENDLDVTGWWMSEKLDGVRAWWSGRVFLSRLGNEFSAPAWFTAGLPDHPLDGELWVGRKMFQDTVSIVRRADGGDEWRKVKYVLFDVPQRQEPFEKRIEWLRESFAPGKHPHAWAIEHQQCRGLDHIKEEMARVEALGGEGLMVRQPGSLYVAGRSTTLLKIKRFFDAEARVLRHVPGAGRHAGRLGALEVELPDGTRFSVGTGLSDAEREEPPPVGSIITFRYQEMSRDGVPRFPAFVGIRYDFAWPTAAAPTKVDRARSAINPVNPKGAAAKPHRRTAAAAGSAERDARAATEVAVADARTPAGTPARTKGRAPGQRAAAATPVAVSTPATAAAAAPAAPALPPTAAALSARADGRRRFECAEGASSKFWEVVIEGACVKATHGRIGSSGVTNLKTAESPEAAAAAAAKLIAEKLRKGYREV